MTREQPRWGCAFRREKRGEERATRWPVGMPEEEKDREGSYKVGLPLLGHTGPQSMMSRCGCNVPLGGVLDNIGAVEVEFHFSLRSGMSVRDINRFRYFMRDIENDHLQRLSPATVSQVRACVYSPTQARVCASKPARMHEGGTWCAPPCKRSKHERNNVILRLLPCIVPHRSPLLFLLLRTCPCRGVSKGKGATATRGDEGSLHS